MDTQFENLHQLAMEMVSKAIIQKNEDYKTYQDLMKQAYEIECKAAYMLYGNPDIEPARSILFQSAANIASEIKMYDEAIKMVYAALSGKPPQHIAENLNDLLETIQFSRHMVKDKIEMSKNTLNISIYGPLVGSGIVLYDALKRKLDAVEKMLLRIIQRNKYPEIFNSGKLYDLKKSFPTFIQTMEAGCLSVGLKVGLDETKESNLLDRQLLETSIEDLATDVGFLNDDDLSSLKIRIGNDDYYNSIVELYREMLPDGKNITGINIMAALEDKSVNLHITKTKPEFPIERTSENDQDPVTTAEKGSELILEGYLKMADRRKKEPFVRLVLPTNNGREYKVYLDEATIDDVVSSYWDMHVALKVVKKGKQKLVYQDIMSV